VFRQRLRVRRPRHRVHRDRTGVPRDESCRFQTEGAAMKPWRLIVFVLVALAQLAAPGSLIWKRENTLRKGSVWKFRTAPVDPVDAFRGRYVALQFEVETQEVTRPANAENE